jgi:hypothetical protein
MSAPNADDLDSQLKVDPLSTDQLLTDQQPAERATSTPHAARTEPVKTLT